MASLASFLLADLPLPTYLAERKEAEQTSFEKSVIKRKQK